MSNDADEEPPGAEPSPVSRASEPAAGPADPVGDQPPEPSGWQLPPAPKPRRPMPKLVLWLFVTVNLAVFGLLAFAIFRLPTGPATDAYAMGYAAGTLLGTLAISLGAGFGLRWLYLRPASRTGPLLSPWILLTATLVLALQFLRVVGTIPASSPAPDAALWVRDATPYALEVVTAEQAAALLPGETGGGVELRQVLDEGTLVGFVFVGSSANFDADQELPAFATSATGGSSQGERMTVGGRPAVLVHVGSDVALAFVDGHSYLIAIRAADEASAKAIAGALIAHAP